MSSEASVAKRSRSRRGAARAALAFALGLLALELILQLGALAIWCTARRPPEALPPGAGRVVLCIGDSFTFGLGASTKEYCYPMQLERMLNAAGEDRWSVVNGGWPSRTSRDVLLELDDQLRRYAPELVYVLVGHNDAWGSPELVTERARSGAGFPLRWRTGRMLALLFHGLRGVADAPPPFVGRWHDERGREVTFEASGRMYTADDEMRWSQDRDTLVLDAAHRGVMRVAWRREDDELWLRGGPWVPEVTLAPGASPRRAGSLEGARSDVAHAVATGEQEAAARGELARLLAQRDPERARAELARLSKLASAGDPQARNAEIRVHAALGDHAAALRKMLDLLATAPSSFEVWDLLAAAGTRPEYRAGAERALRAAEVVARRTDRKALGLVLSGLATVVHEDAEQAVRWMAEATLLGNSDETLLWHLRGLRGRLTREAYVRAVDAVAREDGDRARLLRIWDESGVDRSDSVFEQHLHEIVSRCRVAGAEPVLLDYPVERASIQATVRRVGEALGVGTVAIRAAFAARVDGVEQLFAGDRLHCNDAGYEIVARLVFEDVRSR